MRNIIHQDGFIGFYRGFGPLLAREIPGSFFFFGGYEGTKLLLMTSEEEKIDPSKYVGLILRVKSLNWEDFVDILKSSKIRELHFRKNREIGSS